MNVKPRTIFTGDNLPVLRGMEAESIDMIYADPPFSKGRKFAAPIGSKAAGAMFRDAWTLNDVDVAWSGEIRAMNPAVSAQIEASGLSAGSSLQYVTFTHIGQDIRPEVETVAFGEIPIPEEIATAGYPDFSVDDDGVTAYYVFV